jgi:hypothetical protein
MAFFVVGLLVSSVGFVLMSYGRKLQRPPQLVAGVCLLVVPYLVPTVPWLLLTTALLMGLMWAALMREW